MSIAMPRLDRLPAAERGITLADFLVPIRVGERMSSRVRSAILIVAGALLIYLTARLSIRLPDNPVPITAQTFGVLLVGGALGFRRGMAATALYVLVGIVGVPFFAEGRGGIQVIWGATGGYLVGFIVAGAIVGRLAELGWDRNVAGSIGAMIVGSIVIYLLGVPWLATTTGQPLDQAVLQGVVPFLPFDILKLLAAAAVFPAAWWVVGRRPGEG